MSKQEIPQRGHVMMSILSTIYMLPEQTGSRSERGMMMEAMINFCFRAWGWNVEKFREELDAYKKSAEENRGQLVTWFSPDGFQFEFRLPK